MSEYAENSLTAAEREELDEVIREIPKLFTENLARMSDYQKKRYLPSVQEYCKTYVPIMKGYHSFCVAHPDRKEIAAQACAEAFMAGVRTCISDRASGKKMRDRIAMEQYRLVMAAFVIPCINEMKAENSQGLIDEIMKRWKKTYPDFIFVQTDVTTLNNGFKLRLGF